MIKTFLKKIFPIVFLKRAFLLYNIVKSFTFDKIVFRKAHMPTSFYLLKELKNPFIELNISLELIEPELRKLFIKWTDPAWLQVQYIVSFKSPGFIEPGGWGVTESIELIYPSLGFATAPYVRKPSFYKTFVRKRKITKLDKVISLRDTGEENYFHFFNDVLSKLFFLESKGIPCQDYSIVIGYQLFEKPYFKFFANTNYFKSFNWHIQQPNEWVSFREAIFCKPFTHTKIYFDKTLELCNLPASNTGSDKIFLIRSKKSLRYIENFENLYDLLKEFGFTIVDASEMSFQMQVQTFRNTRYLVGIHGAGLTNMIFRNGKPLSVLEIVHPFPYIPFHYVMLSKIYNYKYQVLMGTIGKQSTQGGFFVSPHELRLKLESLLASS